MSLLYDIGGEPVYLGRYVATVVDNADPLSLGRVRFVVHGLIEPSSGWAFPVGGAHSSGSAQRGAFDVPDKGATVLASFLVGDVDQPLYESAWRGTGEALTQTPAPANASKVKIYETSRFLIVLNAVGGTEELLILDKTSGDKISMKPDQLKVQSSSKVTVVSPHVELGDDGLGTSPLINGVVLASGIDTLTGVTYGVLGSASSVVTAKKS